MEKTFRSYAEVKHWRDKQIVRVKFDHVQLNRFHDELIQHVYRIASAKVQREKGFPPSSFAFFLMGSGGRFEQALISDQDHGMVYSEKSKQAAAYFQHLGEEVSLGLEAVGYLRCDGGVMSSNPKWCKSVEEWEEQLKGWMREDCLSSIRELLIFCDARVIIGEKNVLLKLKRLLLEDLKKNNGYLLCRMLENTMHVPKVIGPIGQFLPETHGVHAGAINIKQTAFFTYVNSVRLLALKEGIVETPTIERLERLSEKRAYGYRMNSYKASFQQLLAFRLQSEAIDYDSMHYLSLDKLTKTEKIELKQIIKEGIRLFKFAKRVIEEGC